MNDIDNIAIVEPKSTFDVSQWEGIRVKIDKVEKVEVLDYFSGPDHTFVANPTEKKWVIEVTTEPIRELVDGKMTGDVIKFTNEDSSLKEWRVTARFNLQKDKEGKLVISKHPKSKMWAFLRRLGCERPSEMIGRLVTLTVVPSARPDDDRKFLRLVGA